MTRPGLYGDGSGLWLQVSRSGLKSWICRYDLAGRRREMGLGSCITVDLVLPRRTAARNGYTLKSSCWRRTTRSQRRWRSTRRSGARISNCSPCRPRQGRRHTQAPRPRLDVMRRWDGDRSPVTQCQRVSRSAAWFSAWSFELPTGPRFCQPAGGEPKSVAERPIRFASSEIQRLRGHQPRCRPRTPV